MPSATIPTGQSSHFIAGGSSVHAREQRPSSHIFNQRDDAVSMVMDPSVGVDEICHFFDNEEVQEGKDSGK